MNVSKLLRFLLTRVYCAGIVEVGGGGAAVEDGTEEGGEEPSGEAAEGDDTDGTEDQPAEEDDAGEGSGAEDDADGGDEVVVSIAGEEADEDGPEDSPVIRDIRRSQREAVRALRKVERTLVEREAEIASLKGTAAPGAVVVGAKPTLESCDFDPEKFGVELEAWHDRKRQADEQQRTRQQSEEQQRQQWQTRIDSVTTAAAGLKVRDYDEATQAFDDTFSAVQQGIVIGGPDDPKASALLRYALGKNPTKAKELAAIKDPVKFAFAVAKLETQLKVTQRKSAPTPDKPVRSSVAGAAAVDSNLARLQAEADKTGDRSKVAAYLRSKNKAKQAA
jgi:hypothetical protein